jgi:menaquinone-dependent protoporphyrinogen oxidase
MNVLVAYASAHGSTAEMAAFIADRLRERYFEVTVASVEEVQTLDGFDAFVLGSAIHGGMWLTPMGQFIDRFNAEFAGRPTFLFMSCIRVLEPDGPQHVVQHYVNYDALRSLNLREVKPFAGKLEMSAIDWDERWTLAARYDGSAAPGSFNRDFRDWNAIRAWADKVADSLLTGASR